MEKMKDVKNTELAVKIALQAHDDNMAQLITENMVMLAWYHNAREPLSSIQLIGRLACGIREDNSPVIALPVDYMTWNKRVSDLATYLTEEYQEKGLGIQLWLSGQLSDLARQQFQDRGWSIHKKAREYILKSKH